MKSYPISQRVGLALGLLTLTHSATALDWPQWRGPNRDDISQEKGLLKDWPSGGPKQAWVYSDAGLGYAGFSVADGRVFTQGARGEREFLIALDEKSGKELWVLEFSDLLKNGWGDGPRGTPTVDGDLVYSISGTGEIVCAQVKDGKKVWQSSMGKFGGSKPNWGYTESPLIDGNRLICTPGGNKGTMVALDKKKGTLLWQSKEFTEGAQYSSPVPAVIHGKRQYVQLTQKAFAGVDAETGKTLWKHDWPGRTAVIPTPIVQGDEVFICSGYGVGSALYKVQASGDVVEVYSNKNMKNHHGGVLLLDGHLYGYSDGLGWVCMKWADGEVVWEERDALRKGAISYADGRLYCLDETNGELALAEASPKGWKEHGRFKLNPQAEDRPVKGKVWVHPVIANGRLFLRDQRFVVAYDIKAR